MTLLIMFVVLFVVTIFPVMIGARVVGANNRGFGSALLAVLLLTAVSAACDRLIANQLLNFLITAGVGGVVISAALGTTFWRALGVAVIATAIQIGIVLLFFGAAVAAAH